MSLYEKYIANAVGASFAGMLSTGYDTTVPFVQKLRKNFNLKKNIIGNYIFIIVNLKKEVYYEK